MLKKLTSLLSLDPKVLKTYDDIVLDNCVHYHNVIAGPQYQNQNVKIADQNIQL